MPDTIPERGPIYEKHLMPRAEQRGSLKVLREVLGRVGPDSPLEGMRELLGKDEVRASIEVADDLMSVYAELADRSQEISADGRWLDRDRLPAEIAAEGFDLLLIGALVSQFGTPQRDFGSATVRLMFGHDPVTTLFRDVLLGKPVPEDSGEPWKDALARYRIPFEKLNALACIRGLQTSLTQIALASAGLPRPHPRTGAVISSIAPNPANAGEAVIIRGTGLGNADATTVLVFGKNVAAITLWTDTEIRAIAPQMQGECCVSIVEQAVAAGDSIGLLLEATAELSGSLGVCFGAAGIIAGKRFEKIPHGEWTADATCQIDGRNAIWIGTPSIELFSANDATTTSYTWRPHRPLTLSWRVLHADTVAMARNTLAGAPPSQATVYVPSDPLPTGSVTMSPIDSLTPWQARYRLSATNRCGTSEAALDINFAARIGLVAVSGGMRCSFQAGALTVMGQLLDTEPAVYGGSGFGALAVRTAAANFRNATPLRDFWSTVSDPTDLFTFDHVVDQLSTIDHLRYREFVASAQVSSDLLALGYGARGGSKLDIPAFDSFDEILMREMIIFGTDKAKEQGAMLASQLADSIMGPATSALSNIPWAAIFIFAAKVGIQTGVAISVRNKVLAALARKGVRNPAPLIAAIDALVAAAGPVKAGAQIRLSLGNLESGDVNYADETGVIVAQPLGSLTATGTLTEVLRASVSTPSWLPPVKIDHVHFVDGAVIDPAPVDAVVDAGADHIFILQPNARHLLAIDSFDSLGFASIEQRAMQMRERGFLSAAIAPHERWLRKDNAGVPVVGDTRIGVELIEATLDLTGLDAYSGENGLISIFSDYGYLRAFDVLAPSMIFPNDSQRDARANLRKTLAEDSDVLTGTRYYAWYLEHFLNGTLLPFVAKTKSGIELVSSVDSVVPMRSAKRSVRSLIEHRLTLVRIAFASSPGGLFPPAAAVPASFASWFMDWEKHPWTWDIGGAFFNPWGELIGFEDGFTAAAETPPTPIDPALFGPIP